MTTLLEVDSLAVRYGQTRAVDGLSLRVAASEVVGVVGPNGAGKSTTLAAIAGLVRPASGTISFDGGRTSGRSPEALVRRGLALVPEGRQIFATLTVEENLRLPTFTGRHEDADAAVERELERFPVLRGCLHRHAGSLSGGEQQQLAIARALLSNPRLLMLDEPSLGLAPRIVDAVFECLAALHDEGVAILLVEQNAARTIAFADRTYVLRAGRVELEGRADALRGDPRLEASYLGDLDGLPR